MEENAENRADKAKEEPVKKKSNFKVFAWGFTAAMVLVFIFFGIIKYNESQNEKRLAAEKLKYEIEHAGVVRDSLARVAIVEAKHRKMKYEIHKFDSARATLRYRIGDVVYLKPDSIRGVVSDITADSSLCCYTYILNVGNKDGLTIICERKEKLIY